MNTDRAILKRLVANMRDREVEPLRPLIDAYLIERDASPNRVTEHTINMKDRLRPGGRFSPSSMGGCMRAAAFKYVGVRGRKRLDPDLELVFEDGKWRHHKWQAILLDMQAVLGEDKIKVISFEEPIEIPELYIAGNSDEVVRVNRRKRVIDYKGINDMGYSWVFTNDEPREEHVQQITTYLKGHRIPRGSLFYDNKNNQQTRIFEVTLEERVWNQVREWVEDVIHLMQREKLPPMHPECQAGNFLYNKCIYSRICYGPMTPVQIRRRMYRHFPGIEEAWEESRHQVQEDQ